MNDVCKGLRSPTKHSPRQSTGIRYRQLPAISLAMAHSGKFHLVRLWSSLRRESDRESAQITEASSTAESRLPQPAAAQSLRSNKSASDLKVSCPKTAKEMRLIFLPIVGRIRSKRLLDGIVPDRKNPLTILRALLPKLWLIYRVDAFGARATSEPTKPQAFQAWPVTTLRKSIAAPLGSWLL